MPDLLKLFLCKCLYVCMCVCVHMSAPRLLITSGMIWTPHHRLNKFYSFYMAVIVGITSMHGLIIKTCHRNQPNKSKLALYKP